MPRGFRPRVILADDFEGLHAAIARLLSPICDVVGYTGDGLSVLDLAARLRPDVVVVDLHLPGLNGLEVCRALNDHVPPIKGILLTAADDDATRASALAAGAVAYVLKMRITDDLLPAIERACRDSGNGDRDIPSGTST